MLPQVIRISALRGPSGARDTRGRCQCYRLNPAGAEEDIAMLQAMDFEVVDDPLILRRASRLAIDLNQPLFDTIYHALALETRDAVLVTANTRYMKAGFALDGMVSLADWGNA